MTSKSIQTIDKTNILELKEELYNRKRDLVSMKIHGTLKQDPEVIKKGKDLKKECQKITMFIYAIEKIQKEQKTVLSGNNSEKIKKSFEKINKKVK
jgi:hypothetical protein